MKSILINNEVFRYKTLFLLDCSFDEAREYVKNYKNFPQKQQFLETWKSEEIEKDFGGITIYNTDLCVVWVSKRNIVKVLSDVAHEITHVIINIMKVRNITLAYDNDEFIAYHVSFYMDRILPLFIDKKPS